MFYSKEDVLSYVKTENVHFIRLTFFDLFGHQKNISILPDRLEKAFSKGVAIDAALIEGLYLPDHESRDLLLFPDPTTMMLLPWRSGHENVIFMICDLFYPDGRPYIFDTRYLLKKVIRQYHRLNIDPLIASKFQFYLLTGENSQLLPYDQGGYLDVSPLDKAENMRRDICLTLEEMGLPPYKSFHQRGPGQNEIDFHFTDALHAADEAAIFKWVTKTLAHSNGLEVDFAAVPDFLRNIEKPSSSSLQVQIKFFENNDELLNHFVAGILSHLPALAFFLNPLKNSYQRFMDPMAQQSIFWSSKERHVLLRKPAGFKDIVELRDNDVRANPYLIFWLILQAGLDGINKNLELPEEGQIVGNYPESLNQAGMLAKEDQWLKDVIPDELRNWFLEL